MKNIEKLFVVKQSASMLSRLGPLFSRCMKQPALCGGIAATGGALAGTAKGLYDSGKQKAKQKVIKPLGDHDYDWEGSGTQSDAIEEYRK